MKNPLAVCLDRNPFETVDALIARAADVGFDRIELFEMDATPLWSAPETAARIHALAQRYELIPQYHAPYVGPFDLAAADAETVDGATRATRLRAPESVRDVLSVMFDRAERLGARLVTVHCGSCPPPLDRAEALRNVVEGIRLAVPDLERRRLRLAVENHTPAIIQSAIGDHPEDFDWLLARLPYDCVGRTVDFGHAHIQSHLEDYLARPFDRVFNVHLHDNHGVLDDHLPLGRGALPLDMILARLQREAYTGPITLEFFGSDEDYRDSIRRVRTS